MAEERRHIFEPLYLDKGITGQDVCISEQHVALLSQSHIDCMRFMYRQFKKKHAGVIVKEEAGQMLVVLFLHALCRKIDANRPCLILCTPDNLPLWKKLFQLYMEDMQFAAVVFEATTTNIHNRIYVNTFLSKVMTKRTDWSIIAVDDEAMPYMKQLKQLSAGFKIWITKEDPQKNLNYYKDIYNWLHPHEKCDINNIISKNCTEPLEMSIFVDSFLNDTVFVISDSIAETCVKSETQLKIKNKDPTGTKVKSSKRRKLNVNDNLEQKNVYINVSSSDNEVVTVDDDADEDVGFGTEFMKNDIEFIVCERYVETNSNDANDVVETNSNFKNNVETKSNHEIDAEANSNLKNVVATNSKVEKEVETNNNLKDGETNSNDTKCGDVELFIRSTKPIECDELNSMYEQNSEEGKTTKSYEKILMEYF